MIRPRQPDDRETLSQTETVVLLQQTIEQLRQIVSQLTTDSVENLPSRAIIDNLLTSTRQLTGSLAPISPDEFEGIEAIETPSEKTDEKDDLSPDFNRSEPVKTGIFRKIRSILPTSVREKIPDWLFTGLLTGSLIAILLVSVLVILKNFPDIAVNLPFLSPKATPETIETPPELQAPDLPIPVPLTLPKPKLTPEQSLVAAIQSEITDLTHQYPEEIISTVEADFLGSRLTVVVGDNWYTLDPKQQDKLADSIFARSTRLDFRRLELKDRTGVLLARSPVVGNQVVIVQRSQLDKPE